MVSGRMIGRVGYSAAKIAGISLFSTLRFGLLRAGTTGGAPLPPLEVECKPLWQPENVARAYVPDPRLENSGSDAAPGRAASRPASSSFHPESSTLILGC